MNPSGSTPNLGVSRSKSNIYPGEEGCYVAETVHLPVVTQGRTYDETIANLREALALHLEDEPDTCRSVRSRWLSMFRNGSSIAFALMRLIGTGTNQHNGSNLMSSWQQTGGF